MVTLRDLALEYGIAPKAVRRMIQKHHRELMVGSGNRYVFQEGSSAETRIRAVCEEVRCG